MLDLSSLLSCCFETPSAAYAKPVYPLDVQSVEWSPISYWVDSFVLYLFHDVCISPCSWQWSSRWSEDSKHV